MAVVKKQETSVDHHLSLTIHHHAASTFDGRFRVAICRIIESGLDFRREAFWSTGKVTHFFFK